MSPFYWSNLNFFRTLYVLHTGTLEFGMFTGSFVVLDKHNCRLKFSYDCYIPILEFQAIPCNSIKVVSSILESSKHYNPWPQKLTATFIFANANPSSKKPERTAWNLAVRSGLFLWYIYWVFCVEDVVTSNGFDCSNPAPQGISLWPI